MGWVVKSWRAEGLAPLVLEHARHSARGMLEAAERDARRVRRAARRERSRTEGELRSLEDLGSELLEAVREQRRAAPGAGGPWPDGPAAPALRARDLRPRRAAPRRARIRDSPLAELFRATAS